MILLLAEGLNAQPQLTPRIRSFDRTQHGGGNQNWAITQGADGNIYTANTSGILRFDGLNWTIFQLPAHATVRTVAYHEGRLYAGGYGEFGYFEQPASTEARYISLAVDLPDSDRREEIWHIEVLEDGRILFQSFSKLYILQHDGTVKREDTGGIMFARAEKDRLLLPLIEEGIYDWLAPSGPLLLPGTESLSGSSIRGLYENADGITIATDSSIYRLTEGSLDPWSQEVNRLLRGQGINRILLLRDGSLAVGTILNGLYLFNQSGQLTFHLNYAAGLANNTVLGLFEDRSGNLWVGLDQGLDLIVRNEPFRYYHRRDQSFGSVYAATQYQGDFYLGTNQGLYRYLDGEDNFRVVPGTAGQVWELRLTGQGLLCGHNEGTFLIKDRKATQISTRSGGWQTISLSKDSSRFLQAHYTGLSILNLGGVAGHGALESRLVEFLAPLRFLTRVASDEVLALHGTRGAYHIKFDSSFSRIIAVDTFDSPKLIKPILTVFSDSVIVQSREGHFLYQADQLLPLTELRGVELRPGRYAFPGRKGTDEWFLVLEDRITFYQGHKWQHSHPLSLRSDFLRIVPGEGEDYLLLLEDGIATYSPSRQQDTSLPLRVAVANLTSTGWRHFDSTAFTSVAYTQNNLRFSYALAAFDRPIRYRTRIRGFNDRWSDWSDRGSREVTNLPEGEYIFEVEANWFDSFQAIRFSVRPPWYRTSLAYFIYALVFLAFLTLLYRWHRQRLDRQARQLEAVRMRQLQRQRMLARNEQLELDVNRKSQELANTSLTLAKKNEMLLTLKEELTRQDKQRRQATGYDRLLHLIDSNLDHEEDWAIFESHFNEVHEAFLKRLRQEHPALTAGELRLAAYLRTSLSSKEIAPLLHISVRGVENKRYRLRKKLGLTGNDNLNQYLQDF